MSLLCLAARTDLIMHRKALLLAALAVLSTGTTHAIDPQSPYVPTGYIQTFGDDFTSLSDISPGPGPYTAGVNWYNGVKQCCMSPTVAGQRATMYPTPVDGKVVNPYSIMTANDGGGVKITLSLNKKTWNSGVMTSVDSGGKGFAQRYGYFEIKARLPGTPGTWPAFWMLNVANVPGIGSGEIDILEAYGGQSGYMMTIHDWTTGASIQQQGQPSPAGVITDAKAHIWGLLWTAQTMTFYLDGVQQWQVATPVAQQQPYYMLVDLGLGGGWPTNATPNTNVMLVEYVRAYQAP
jgi:beta-glucanase (GH16 family)